jgi:hypothetical protein
MEQEKISTLAAKFKKAFSEGVLNELGKASRYCHPGITPQPEATPVS